MVNPWTFCLVANIQFMSLFLYIFRFACPTCGKQFVRKCHYEGHLRTHSTERPFKCNTCSRTFKDRKHWREHTKRVHANEINMQSILEDALTSTTHTFHSSMVSTTQFIHDSTFILGGNQNTFDNVEQFHSSSSLCWMSIKLYRFIYVINVIS